MNLINLLFKEKEQTEMITEETLPDVQQIKVPDLKQYLLNGYKEIREVKNQNEQLQLKLEEESKYKLLYDGALVTLEELRKENEELKNKLNLKQFDVNIVYNDYLEKLDEYERNTIPIQRIKDIIDRIDYDIKKTKEIISKNTNIYASYRKNDYQIVRLKAMNTKSLDIKKRLQELLDGSDADVGSIESEE